MCGQGNARAPSGKREGLGSTCLHDLVFKVEVDRTRLTCLPSVWPTVEHLSVICTVPVIERTYAESVSQLILSKPSNNCIFSDIPLKKLKLRENE